MEEKLNHLRRLGWRVAVHNDYTLNGVDMTFWLFTHHHGLFVRGEGKTDEEALDMCAALIRRRVMESREWAACLYAR